MPFEKLQKVEGEGQPQNEGQPQGIAPTRKRLGDIVGAFESITTVEYIKGVKNLDWPRFEGKLWQRNYWEHIIRHQQSFNHIAHYIQNNSSNWDKDRFFRLDE